MLGAVIETISLGAKDSYSIGEIQYEPIPIIREAPSLEERIEEKIVFSEPKIETERDIADYINEAYKTSEIPDYISKRFIKKIIAIFKLFTDSLYRLHFSFVFF